MRWILFRELEDTENTFAFFFFNCCKKFIFFPFPLQLCTTLCCSNSGHSNKINYWYQLCFLGFSIIVSLLKRTKFFILPLTSIDRYIELGQDQEETCPYVEQEIGRIKADHQQAADRSVRSRLKEEVCCSCLWWRYLCRADTMLERIWQAVLAGEKNSHWKVDTEAVSAANKYLL